MTLLAQSARVHGLEDFSYALFESATLALRSGDDTYVGRLAIAEEALASGQLSVVIEALLGHVSLDRDSAELRALAQALVFDVPVRDRATEFFCHLAPDVRSTAFFQRLEGILHFNRGAPNESIQPLEAAFAREPQIDTLLCLVRAYFAIKKRDAIQNLVRSTEVDQLDGSPLDRIHLSHVLLDFSQQERALNVAYMALTAGLSDSEVVTKFLGLVLRKRSDGPEENISDSVGTGVWVRITGAGGGSFEALVGESRDRPWGQAVESSNLFISGCLGLKAGCEFKITNSFGVEETWTVAEVRPWWLQAFHHLTGNFGLRYPEAKGFASLTIVDDDIEPVLEQVRRHSAMARQQADVYSQHNIPLVLAAGDRPGGALGFAQYLRSIGEQVKVCSGSFEERTEALRLIQEHQRCGAVVDAFTAWHAGVLGVLPVLEERLGPLAIPAHELGRLREITYDRMGLGEGDSMSLDYRDEQFFRVMESAEERTSRLGVVKSLLSTVEEQCSVEPVQLPDNLTEVGEKLIRDLPVGAFTVGVMAGGSRLLLCEDLVIRHWSREAFGASGVWLQAVLFSAEQAGTMSIKCYAEAVVYLAANRHGYVFVSTPVLLAIFERDDSRDLIQLETVCTYVGGQNAELNSNTKIVADFVNAIWANAQPIVWADDFPVDSKTRKATNLMFRTLILDRHNGEWARWGASLYRELAKKPRRFLLRWCEENFLSVGRLLASLRGDLE